MKLLKFNHPQMNSRYSERGEELSEREVNKFLCLLFGYIILLAIFVAFVIVDASAQSIEDLVPDDSITTESPEVVIIKTPTKQEAERPSMEGVIIPQPPYLDYNNFSAEFVFNLKAGQLKNATRLGLLPEAKELKFFTTPRSAQEDLELYSFTIFLHQRAIKEGKDINFYIQEVKEGRIPIARLKRDVEVCGTGFEIYPNTKICNEFATHQSTEENYYHAKLSVYQLSKRNGELEAICGYGAPKEKPCNDLGWSSVNIWKPKADNRPNEAVVVLDKKYCDGSGQSLISNFRVEDALGGQSASVYFRECNGGNGGRLHMGIRPQGSNIDGPIFIRYSFNGIEECRKVSNPSVRED